MENSPNRILFLPKWYPNKTDPQLGVFVRKTAELVAKKHEVAVLYAHPLKDQENTFDIQKEYRNGVLEVIVYYRSGVLSPLNFSRYLLAMKSGYREVCQDLGAPDLCHVHVMGRPALFASRELKKKGIPFVVTEHFTGFMDGRYIKENSFITRAYHRQLAKKAAGYTAVSEALKKKLTEHGFPEDISVVPNVIEIPDRSSIRKKRQPHEPFRFLNVADQVDERKNISGVIDAFLSLKDKSADIELHLIGGGPDEGAIRDKIGSSGGTDKGIFHHGRTANEDTLRLMEQMDATIVNSRVETFSVVTIESLAFGIPVIATECGGPEEIITSGDGFLIPKDAPNALREAMDKMIREYDRFDPEELHQRIADKYSPEQTMGRLDSLYQAAMDKAYK